MSDAAVVHIGENSPEFVAFRLMERIAYSEDKRIAGSKDERQKPDRAWLLDTYAECLQATRALRSIKAR
jgi:hypothetical protein